jgi:hypothetical protein
VPLVPELEGRGPRVESRGKVQGQGSRIQARDSGRSFRTPRAWEGLLGASALGTLFLDPPSPIPYPHIPRSSTFDPRPFLTSAYPSTKRHRHARSESHGSVEDTVYHMLLEQFERRSVEVPLFDRPQDVR